MADDNMNSNIKLSAKDIVNLCMDNIKPSWKRLFLKNANCKEQLVRCLEFIKKRNEEDSTYINKLCPSINKIMEAFRHFEINELKVVIIGQDPYHTKGVANGLCFSHNAYNNSDNQTNTGSNNQINIKRSIKPSLRWIMKAVIANGYMKDVPDNGDLFPWVQQGVLMINRYLTTTIGLANQHEFWAEFTNEVIRCLSNETDGLIFMLWGKNAQELEKFICNDDNHKHHILKCGHPSPLARTSFKFENCTHFKDANNILDDRGDTIIDWNIPNIYKNNTILATENTVLATENISGTGGNLVYLAYTDGSAVNNGKKNCTAGCSFVIINGVEPNYNLVKSYKEDVKNLSEEVPTSPKAELLGVIKCLEYFIDELSANAKSLTIYCDNQYTVNTINIWGAKWKKDGILHKKKNTELVIKLLEYKDIIINKGIKLTVNHIRSHQTEPTKNTSEWYRWYYNDMADKLAGSAY